MNYVVTPALAAQYRLEIEDVARALIEPLAKLDLLVEIGTGSAGLRPPAGPRPVRFIEILGEANRIVRDTLRDLEFAALSRD